MEQRTKAESDPAVAAASILARERFIDWLRDLGEALGIPLPRGASEQVRAAAARIVAERGSSALANYAKLHFKTAAEWFQASPAEGGEIRADSKDSKTIW